MWQREPVVVFDLAQDEAFPPYGESGSELIISRLDARLTVFYEGADRAVEARITFKFSRASQVVRSCFPGVGENSLASSPASLGRLVRIEDSTKATKWTAYWSARPWMLPTLHYQVVLTQANEKIDVFAEGVEILRELPAGA